jgi:hypothetical protein
MSRFDIDSPEAARARVQAACGRLEQAAATLAARPFEDRLGIVTRVLTLWTADESPWRRELIDALVKVSTFDRRTVAEGLESALRAWSPTRFADCCRRELAMASHGGALALSPFSWTAVLAGGSIPMPTMLSALLPLVAGSPVALRETSKDPVTGKLLKRSLEACDPDLARAFEPLSFSANDQAAMSSLLAAPCVVATGSDETIRSIGARLEPIQRFVAYGHRFSIAALGPDCAIDPAGLEEIARSLALDVARWDQSGCLSPVVVYLVDLDATTRHRVAAAIAAALDSLSSEMPRGVVPRDTLASQAIERSEARMRAATDSRGALFEGLDSTVVLEADARPRPAPLFRFVRLLPVDSITEWIHLLEPFRGHLSNVALAGFPSPNSRSLEQTLAPLGVSRFTRPGRLQTPPIDWPHDGMPLLLPLTRFTQSETSFTI